MGLELLSGRNGVMIGWLGKARGSGRPAEGGGRNQQVYQVACGCGGSESGSTHSIP